MQVQSVGTQGMPAPAQAPAQPHPGAASSDADGARRREAAHPEQAPDSATTPRRSVVAHAYTAAGRAVEDPPEERSGISVLA